MASTTPTPPAATEASRSSWLRRIWGTVGQATEPRSKAPTIRVARDAPSRIEVLAESLTAGGREAFLLLREAQGSIEPRLAESAWDALRRRMALVPAGRVPVVVASGETVAVDVSAFYIDRHAVTNDQFERFVLAGGYENLEFWSPEIWPSVMKFTDGTGQPGPRDWSKGRAPRGLADHPVVGVCWYEAVAYARWVGKRLPTAAEWQKAGGWPEQIGGGACTRYPWGNLFEKDRANLALAGRGQTAPVSDFASGSTPNGIAQLCGNVWEWLDDSLDAFPVPDGYEFQTWQPMRRIVGGAFDTHFPAEAACQFITGQPELDRRSNLGFRCAISLDSLRSRS